MLLGIVCVPNAKTINGSERNTGAMTLRELLDQFETWNDEQRGQLAVLSEILCGVSMATIKSFQCSWDSSRPYSEFVTEQNKIFRQCITLEVSPMGTTVRSEFGLAPLSLDDELPMNA